MNDSKFSFIKKFKIDNNHYIYDVNTNAFLRVDELSYTLIDKNEKLDEISILKKYPKDMIENNLKKIVEMKSKGYFAPQRPLITYFHKIQRENFHDFLFSILNNKLHKITLVVSEKCNLRCKYCAYSGQYLYNRKHSNKIMNIETMKKAVDFYFSHNTANKEKNISFYGGEPLLNFNTIKECVNYCKNQYCRETQFNMTTNGTLLNEEKINFLAENNFSLLISIDGPKEIHDRYRVFKNAKGTFNTIIKNIKFMKSLHHEYYKKKVRFSIVLTPDLDFNLLDNFISDADIKPAGISISDINDHFTTFFNQFSEEQLKTFDRNRTNIIDSFCTKLAKREELSEIEKNMFKTKFFTMHRRDMDILPATYPSNGQCTLGERALLINIDGSFNFCTRVNDSFNLGNLDIGYDYKRIEKIYFDLDKLFNKKCFGCWAIRFCMKCIRDVNKNGEIDEEIFNKMCEMKKKSILNEIKDYIRIRESNYHALDYLENITLT
ncbi:MAG TPA: radical SAM protein [Candidatus Deferrimicrobium sp.]|nr:radical SAM protein [Candidatus Deferrimicrobium sp.]